MPIERPVTITDDNTNDILGEGVLFYPDDTPTPPPPIQTETLICQIPSLRVRDKPSTTGTQVGQLAQGEAVEVLKTPITGGVYQWRRLSGDTERFAAEFQLSEPNAPYLKKASEQGTLIVIDLSHWNAGFNGAGFKASDGQALINKCSEGTTWYDSTYSSRKSSAKDNQIIFGAYHYYINDLDPIAQAEHFYNRAGHTDLPLCGDFEDGRQAPNLATNIKKFLDRLEELTGRKPIIYTRASWWNQWVGNVAWAKDYHFWVAHYTDAKTPILPQGVNEWLLWQYTSTGDGRPYGVNDATIDINRFNGSLNDLLALVEDEPTTPPPPQGSTLKGNITIVEKTDTLNAKSYFLKFGNFAWSAYSKLWMNWRASAYWGRYVDAARINEETDMLNNAHPTPTTVPINIAAAIYHAFHPAVTDQSTVNSTNQQWLSMLGVRNMHGVIKLADSHSHGQPIQLGDSLMAKYHTVGSTGHLNDAFYAERAYEQLFFPKWEALLKSIDLNLVDALVILNEGQGNNWEDQKRFYREAAKMLYLWSDGKVPILAGLKGIHHINKFRKPNYEAALEFYGEIPHLHGVSNNLYPDFNARMAGDLYVEEDLAQQEYHAALDLHLPFVILETATTHKNPNINFTLDQRTQQEQFFKRWTEIRRASAFGIWGFAGKSPDAGMGDRTYFDVNFNNAYFPLKDLYAFYAHTKFAQLG